MKKLLISLWVVGLLVTGCSLIPKKVEFFQKKVKAVPEVSAKAKETQRQAADYVKFKTQDAKLAAIQSGASNTVVVPISEANTVADALSTSLGPPEDPWKKEAEKLALLLKEQQAVYNAKLANYAEQVEKLEGKKIEGTGLIRIPYFVYVGCIALVIFLAWSALKIYGSVNPMVGLGTNTVGRVGSGVLSRGFAEIVQAGEQFKEYLDKSGFDAAVKEHVLDLFQRAHKEEQSKDTQNIIKKITV